MIFSENNVNKELSRDDIASLIHWWSLAGVDINFSGEPRSLFTENNEAVAKLTSVEVPKSQKSTVTDSKYMEFPEEVDAFLAWLQEPENLVESDWTQYFSFPEGSIDSEILILSAMPEDSGPGLNSQFGSSSRQLLQNMIKAIGSNLDKTFLFPLALGKPVDGNIPDKYFPILVARALHLLSIVQPRSVILFGDTVSRAFLGVDLLTARKKKQYINHVSSKTEAIVTFHPRILLERPELKTEAWKDLQQLTRIGAQ